MSNKEKMNTYDFDDDFEDDDFDERNTREFWLTEEQQEEYIFDYASQTEEVQELLKDLLETNGGNDGIKYLEATYLYNYNDSLLREDERLSVILPLIKACAEYNYVSDELKGELEYYYDFYEKGTLDFALNDLDKDIVVKDLVYCYQLVFNKDWFVYKHLI